MSQMVNNTWLYCHWRKKTTLWSEQRLYWVNNTLDQWKLNQQLLSVRDSLSVSKINSQERVQMWDKILWGNYYIGSHKTFQKVLRIWRWVINCVYSVGKGGGKNKARDDFTRLWWGIELSPTGRMDSAVEMTGGGIWRSVCCEGEETRVCRQSAVWVRTRGSTAQSERSGTCTFSSRYWGNLNSFPQQL